MDEPIAQHRYKLTVAYDGSAFHGWQKQEPAGQEPLRTVQGELENALVNLLRTPREQIGLKGASRTDTGVHAVGQVCQFDAATPIPLERLCMAINSRLPEDIDARHVEIADPSFDAISDVIDKQYRYRIFNAAHRPLGIRHLVHHEWAPLDVEAMNDAAGRLVGTHDVEGFAAASHGRSTTVRTIYHCNVEARDLPSPPLPPGESGPQRGSGEGESQHGCERESASPYASAAGVQSLSDEDTAKPLPYRQAVPRELHITISGSGFLYNMVRIIAGTLIEVGKGKMPPSRIDEVLATQNRRLAGPTLPPNGLCLEWVRYGASGLTPRRQDAKTPSEAGGASDAL